MNKSEVFYEACFTQWHLTEGYFSIAHFTVTFLTLITSSTNELLCNTEVSNELCNLPASKAKLPYTKCIRAFNRSDPNTMTCTNVSVKQYIGILDILLKFQTRATISRRGRRTGLEERWGGRNVVLSGFIALWVRVLSIIDLVAKVEAIHLSRIFTARSPRKSELLSDKIGRFNFKMEERCRRKSLQKRRTLFPFSLVLVYLIKFTEAIII